MNKKLLAIAKLIDKDDVVLDIGCDHAYLAIYLKKNNICKDVFASDINPNALKVARKNIEAAKQDIIAYLSDGFKNIEREELNTAVIAGMGTDTIIDIVKFAPSSVNKFIISSNNNHDTLRKYLYKNKLYIQQEIIIFEKNKYYVIMLVTKTPQKENKLTLKYGRSKCNKYYKYLLAKEKDILTKIPSKKIITKHIHKTNIKELTLIIEKKLDCFY